MLWLNEGCHAVITSEKVDFRAKNINKEAHFIIIKGSIHQENIKTLNVYVLITESQNTWSKNIELQREIYNSPILHRFQHTSFGNW